MQIPLLIAIVVGIAANSETPAPQQDNTAQTSSPVQAELQLAEAPQAVTAEEVGRYIKPLEPIFASQLLAQPMQPIQLASIEPLPLMKIPLFTHVTGEHTTQLVPIEQGGKDVPIQVALQTLTPEGYKVDVPAGMQDITVDWKPAATRDEAFDSLRISKADIGIVVNTDKKLVQVMSEKDAVKVYVDPKPIQWELRTEDVRLDRALRRWAKDAGYTIRWDADRYVLIAASTTFTGTFENAVEQVLDTPGIKLSEYPLEACVYANEPPLLRITRLGDQKEECK
jgi:hypothetical protein